MKQQYIENKNIKEVSVEELLNLFEVPPEDKMGDYALPCFALSKKMKKSPILLDVWILFLYNR